MKDESVVLLDENGLRTDGRRLDQLRPIKITAGVSHRADGSAYVEWGGNKVMAAVYGPRETHPRHKQETDRARIKIVIEFMTKRFLERMASGLLKQKISTFMFRNI